jgi:hypothetical protein
MHIYVSEVMRNGVRTLINLDSPDTRASPTASRRDSASAKSAAACSRMSAGEQVCRVSDFPMCGAIDVVSYSADLLTS